MNIILASQERYKFLENPVDYLDKLYADKKDAALKSIPKRKLFESKKHYDKRKVEYISSVNSEYDKSKKEIKEEANKYSKPAYVYYNNQKLTVPNNFYYDYNTPDLERYLDYLVSEDERKNIITDEDREKARLLNCDLDFNYLQTLINKMNVNNDLVITIKTKDGAIINMRKQDKQESDDIFGNNIFISPEKVR